MDKKVNNILSMRNRHERDKNIEFIEEGHKYIILNDLKSKYISVTTWIHTLFPIFDADLIIKNMMKSKNWNEKHKYWGLSSDQIKSLWSSNGKNVSTLGTNLHFDIECFMNNESLQFIYSHKDLYEAYNNNDNNNKILSINKPKEWLYFINFIKSHFTFVPYRSEWLIYDEELKLSGSIDMVYINEDNTLSIYDWKRCGDITKINNYNKFGINKCICHMPDSNFWHYALQLNIYKAILERNYGKTVKELFLVKLHPESDENNYELINVPFLNKEISELFQYKKVNSLKII